VPDVGPPTWVRRNGLWRSLVSALDWGSRGPGFKSRQPDHEGAGESIGGVTDRRFLNSLVSALSASPD
jgi:hypothetical protein